MVLILSKSAVLVEYVCSFRFSMAVLRYTSDRSELMLCMVIGQNSCYVWFRLLSLNLWTLLSLILYAFIFSTVTLHMAL